MKNKNSKWALLAILTAFAIGFLMSTLCRVKPKHTPPLPLPLAIKPTDAAARKVGTIIEDIRRQKTQEDEVIFNAKEIAIKNIYNLDHNAVAHEWNTRIGEYRESRKDNNSKSRLDNN